MWKNQTQPQQPGTACWSPAWSHTAVGWQPILKPSICQPTWLCWSPWHEQHSRADPTSVQVGLRSGLLAAHPILSTPKFLEVVSEKPCCVCDQAGGREALSHQRNNLPNTNFLTFCAMFINVHRGSLKHLAKGTFTFNWHDQTLAPKAYLLNIYVAKISRISSNQIMTLHGLKSQRDWINSSFSVKTLR